ncbi:hypothetical protein FE257_003367 [Aspergillus nanangensis]|uniref:Uncharacterized protein n=1 Tax=Aspergillus nanangensis TaxID=2582783 RepID=A0AAD4CBR2_ASPNN|nr:hypothetical protein FE257_003367 [Aspergillus nanangensis]
MLFITLGLSTHPTDTLSLDEDGYSDLTNRLGRKLKRLGLLGAEYILHVMRLAKIGGYIRWHMVDVDGEVLSSNIRRPNTYHVILGFERVGSNVIDTKGLREFVPGLGEDLDDLRKLKRNEVDYVLSGIHEVGMVDFVTPSQVPGDNASLPSEMNSASLADATSHSNATTSMDGLTSSGPSNEGIYAGNDFDHLLNQFYGPQQFVSSMAATNMVGEDWPAGIAISPEPVSMDDPIDTTVSLYASPASVNSLLADQQLNFLDAGNTAPLTRSFVDYVSSPESVAAFGSEIGTSPSYMTPPSSVSSPFSVQSIDPQWSFSGHSTHANAAHIWQGHYISQQLQCCRIRDEDGEKKKKKTRKDSPNDQDWDTLSSEGISRIIKAWDFLLPRHPLVCVRELPEKNASMSIRQVLGLPEVWKGIEGAVNYFRVLEADKDGLSTLGPLAKRFAQIYIYLNYEMLSMDGCRTVVNRVLDACHSEPIAQPRESGRDRFSSTHALYVCPFPYQAFTNPVYRRSNKFTDDQIDAFITCALRIRPGTIHLFESLKPMAVSLLYGTAPVDIRQQLDNEATGLLNRNAINSALGEDGQAQALPWTLGTWEAEKSKFSASKAKNEFLATLQSLG